MQTSFLFEFYRLQIVFDHACFSHTLPSLASCVPEARGPRCLTAAGFPRVNSSQRARHGRLAQEPHVQLQRVARPFICERSRCLLALLEKEDLLFVFDIVAVSVLR